MQSWWMQMTETDSVLEQRDVPVPAPGPKQLLMRVRAASLNRGEFLHGGLHGKVGSWKAIGGEGAGEVTAVGSEVTGFAVGDRIMARCAAAFSDYAVVDVAEAIKVPANLSWEQAASIPLTYLVAYDMLVLQGRLKAGEWLLINGVSSGVGVASLQLGKALGAKVIGTSGSQDKLDKLKPLGLDVAVCARTGFQPQVMDATGGAGVNLVVNNVGGTAFAEAVRCLAFEGRLATVGYVDNVLKAEIDLQALHAKRLVLFGVSQKMTSPAQKAEGTRLFAEQMLPLVAAGKLRPLVDRVFPFEQVQAARAHMEANAHVGKIVITA